MDGLHGMENNFVMHGPAEDWVRMADQTRVRGIGLTDVEQSFKPPGGAFEKQRADGGM